MHMKKMSNIKRGSISIFSAFSPNLCVLGHLVEEIDVLALEVERELRVVVPVHDVGPGRLPGETCAHRGPHRVPEGSQVKARSLG